MRKVSIFNIKGGVGKTVSTVNISAILAEKGFKVLVVDMDSQSSSSITFEGYSPEGLNVGDILLDNSIPLEKVIKKTQIENIDILPCNFDLAYIEQKLWFDMSKSMQLRLNEVMDIIECNPNYNYDYCIIDCPPALNLFAINSLVASDEVLIPIKIDRYAYDGIGRLIEEIEKIQNGFNPNLRLTGCFVTMDNKTTINNFIKETLEENLGNKLLQTSIRATTSVVESTFRNMPVIQHKKNSTASKDYHKLVKEVFNV